MEYLYVYTYNIFSVKCYIFIRKVIHECEKKAIKLDSICTIVFIKISSI